MLLLLAFFIRRFLQSPDGETLFETCQICGSLTMPALDDDNNNEYSSDYKRTSSFFDADVEMATSPQKPPPSPPPAHSYQESPAQTQWDHQRREEQFVAAADPFRSPYEQDIPARNLTAMPVSAAPNSAGVGTLNSGSGSATGPSSLERSFTGEYRMPQVIPMRQPSVRTPFTDPPIAKSPPMAASSPPVRSVAFNMNPRVQSLSSVYSQQSTLYDDRMSRFKPSVGLDSIDERR